MLAWVVWALGNDETGPACCGPHVHAPSTEHRLRITLQPHRKDETYWDPILYAFTGFIIYVPGEVSQQDVFVGIYPDAGVLTSSSTRTHKFYTLVPGGVLLFHGLGYAGFKLGECLIDLKSS